MLVIGLLHLCDVLVCLSFLRFLPTWLLVKSTGSLLVHPFPSNVSGVEPSPGFHTACLYCGGGRAENTFKGCVVSLKCAVFVSGQETSEIDATFDATLAAICGFAPLCRALGWLAPDCLSSGFLRAATETAGAMMVFTFKNHVIALKGALFVPEQVTSEVAAMVVATLACRDCWACPMVSYPGLACSWTLSDFIRARTGSDDVASV